MVFEILKVDAPRQIVYGWGNVSVEGGSLETDSQDDQIEPDELDEAVVDFMLHSRESGVMHEGESVGKVVASMVSTPDVMKAFLGEAIGEDALAKIPIGWMLGVRVEDKAVFKLVVTKQLRAFSIQGSAERVPA